MTHEEFVEKYGEDALRRWVACQLRWKQKHKGQVAEQAKRWYVKNRARILGNARRRRLENKNARNEKATLKLVRLRHAMLVAYGGRCACCGESREGFLTLDHVLGARDSARVRYNGKPVGGYRELSRLRKLGWPKDNYRVLCMNCNWATRGGAVCPHKM